MYDTGDVGIFLMVGGAVMLYTLIVLGFGWHILLRWGAFSFAVYLSTAAFLTGFFLLDLSTAGRAPPGGPPRPPPSS